MQLNMPLNFSLFQHKTWEEKIHTAFEEADCQTYTHMCPSVPLPAPQQSLTPYPTPHDSRPRLTLQRQGKKWGRVRKRNPKHHVEPKWKVAFSSTDTSEMVERMPAGFSTSIPPKRGTTWTSKRNTANTSWLGQFLDVQAGLIQLMQT